MNRFFDLLFLFILSPIIIPIVLIISLLAYFFHGRDIFFKQDRLGKNKKVFKLYKFRSMIINAQAEGTGLYSFADDHRITPFGKILRTSSLDEIPQLYNILKGDMSFVGPRPAVVGELDQEKDLPEEIDLRFMAKPGLTGWAQIHGRDNLSWAQKAAFDIAYIKTSGFCRLKMVLYILIYTPFYLLNFSATYEKRK